MCASDDIMNIWMGMCVLKARLKLCIESGRFQSEKGLHLYCTAMSIRNYGMLSYLPSLVTSDQVLVLVPRLRVLLRTPVLLLLLRLRRPLLRLPRLPRLRARLLLLGMPKEIT